MKKPFKKTKMVYSDPNYCGKEDAMLMKVINGRWYSNIYHSKSPGQKLTLSLDAYRPEKRKAQRALGVILDELASGKEPMSAGVRIKKLKIQGRISKRTADILENHIIPFFGDYKPNEVNEKLIESYIESRYGLSPDGELQAFFNTMDKELLALQRTLQHRFGLGYRRPKVKYKRLKKDILPPLAPSNIHKISTFIGKEYIVIYWIMAYTAMDISDVVTLKPADFVDGWIKKLRGKTSKQIMVPIAPELSDLMKGVIWPIDKNERLFREINGKPANAFDLSKTVSTHVRRGCTKAGFPGYGAKYLRRFIACKLLDQGNSLSWIAKVLAHAEGSGETDIYLQVYKETAEAEFNKIKFGGI